MQRVRFLQDFRGVLTDEQFFEAGVEADFADEIAVQLVEDERAELVVTTLRVRLLKDVPATADLAGGVAGTELELELAAAQQLVADGAAELVKAKKRR